MIYDNDKINYDSNNFHLKSLFQNLDKARSRFSNFSVE